jgi:hypothetical protein
VTSTIKGGIVELTAFADTPELFMYGMLCALSASGVWLLLATYCELPVSTTHSIIGCVLFPLPTDTPHPWHVFGVAVTHLMLCCTLLHMLACTSNTDMPG